MTEIIQSKMINLNLQMLNILVSFTRAPPSVQICHYTVIVLHWASLRRQQERLQLL